MNPQLLIKENLGPMLKDIAYPSRLPLDLEQWHCYILDSGHCIFSILKSAYLKDRPILDSMLPIPVKTILGGYEVVDGYVFCTNPRATYTSELGLDCPAEDIEF